MECRVGFGLFRVMMRLFSWWIVVLLLRVMVMLDLVMINFCFFVWLFLGLLLLWKGRIE